jgi:hypothetical protein
MITSIPSTLHEK